MGAPYTDIRIERPPSWEWIDALPGLTAIDFAPPSSAPDASAELGLTSPSKAGPMEIELTFATAEGAKPAPEAFLVEEVERVTGRPVLKFRRRDR